ncbi:MAG: hypothetical protein RIG77_10020 [Cyclobacteriaceae bacterium]
MNLKIKRTAAAKENTRKVLEGLSKTHPMTLEEALKQQEKNSKDYPKKSQP